MERAKISGLVIFLYLAFPGVCVAQQYRFHQYRVEQGLPSDVTKAVTQDSLGFFWIATDDGLVKYDGLTFRTYKGALRSQFVKGFLHTRDGRLLVFGDLDLVEIRNLIDTVIFVPVLRGERVITDSTLSFPKSAYEDKSGNIWMGESKTVIRYDGKKIKRFDFGEGNRSRVLTRSFSFFEDNHGNFYTVAYNGTVYQYNLTADRFVRRADITLPEDVNDVLFFRNQLLAGARNGLFSIPFSERGADALPVKNIFPIRHVSSLLMSPDSSIIVSTFEEDLYRIRFAPGFQWENIFFNFNGINRTYVSREKDIWVSSDKGVVLVQQKLFNVADINSQAHYVQAVATGGSDGKVFYCNKESLISLEPTESGEWARTVLLDDKDHYFQSLQFIRGTLWASTTSNLVGFRDGKQFSRHDFSREGHFIHDIFGDDEDNLWLSQAGTREIKKVRPAGEVERYKVDDTHQHEINLVRQGKRGMYAGAGGEANYLYLLEPGAAVFKNVSLPLSFPIRGDFNVVDMVVRNDTVWLATTQGLLLYDHRTVRRISFQQGFEDFPVSTIELTDHNNLLFANSFGLIRYNFRTGEYRLYDENTGLPSNTISDQGIAITKEGGIWVGTSYGIAYSPALYPENSVTPVPYCVEAKVNGRSSRFKAGLKAAYGSYITLRFSPITFPENKILYEWRTQGEDLWVPLEREELSLADLEDGTHNIEVRAKKNTGFGWSSPTVVTLNVEPPYWKTSEFFGIVLLLAGLISWVSFLITSALLSHRREYLQQQVNERTRELQKANEELMLRNTELDRFVYSASHDLSAPLKSIRGLVQVAKMDKPGEEQEKYLNMMERSVFKLEEFIQEVVTYSRSNRMPVNYEPFSFQEFVQGLLQDHEFSPNFSKINFIVEDEIGALMCSDKIRMKIILNNLISNAIKFHWVDNCRKPFIRLSATRKEGEYLVTVTDNGSGIHEHHLERIFDMFYRATDTTPGSGLGLYILKESVTKLKGRVEAFSKVEHGTTFNVYLPVPS